MPNSWDGKTERRIGSKETQHTIAVAAMDAAKVVADAAAVAVLKVAEAAATAQSVVNIDITYIKKDVTEIKAMLESRYVTKDTFAPVKMIAYGLVSLVSVSVIGALMTVVLIKK